MILKVESNNSWWTNKMATKFITKNHKKIPINEPHASKELTTELDDLARSLTHLKTTRYNGTTGFWKEKISAFEKATRLIKKDELDQKISDAVPHPEGQSAETRLLRVLNTKFGVGKHNDLFPIVQGRIEITSESGFAKDGVQNIRFRLSTNTLDSSSQPIIESLGFRLRKKTDQLDARHLEFEGHIKGMVD